MQSLAQTMRVLAAILLILGLSRAEATAAATSNEISSKKIVYEMDIDNLIDENMETIRDVAWKMDPMQLDDVNFPLNSYVYMLLHTGWAQNLAEVKRVGKCRMWYADKKFNIDLNLGWNDLVFDYRYLIKMLLVNRKGDLHGQMTKLDMHIALQMDFKNYHITLKTLEMVDMGVVNISLEGHLLDWVYNLMIKAVTRVFKTRTLNTISDKTRGMIMHRIDEVNLKFGSMMGFRKFTFIDLTKSINYDDSQFISNAIIDNDNN